MILLFVILGILVLLLTAKTVQVLRHVQELETASKAKQPSYILPCSECSPECPEGQTCARTTCQNEGGGYGVCWVPYEDEGPRDYVRKDMESGGVSIPMNQALSTTVDAPPTASVLPDLEEGPPPAGTPPGTPPPQAAAPPPTTCQLTKDQTTRDGIYNYCPDGQWGKITQCPEDAVIERTEETTCKPCTTTGSTYFADVVSGSFSGTRYIPTCKPGFKENTDVNPQVHCRKSTGNWVRLVNNTFGPLREPVCVSESATAAQPTCRIRKDQIKTQDVSNTIYTCPGGTWGQPNICNTGVSVERTNETCTPCNTTGPYFENVSGGTFNQTMFLPTCKSGFSVDKPIHCDSVTGEWFFVDSTTNPATQKTLNEPVCKPAAPPPPTCNPTRTSSVARQEGPNVIYECQNIGTWGPSTSCPQNSVISPNSSTSICQNCNINSPVFSNVSNTGVIGSLSQNKWPMTFTCGQGYKNTLDTTTVLRSGTVYCSNLTGDWVKSDGTSVSSVCEEFNAFDCQVGLTPPNYASTPVQHPKISLTIPTISFLSGTYTVDIYNYVGNTGTALSYNKTQDVDTTKEHILSIGETVWNTGLNLQIRIYKSSPAYIIFFSDKYSSKNFPTTIRMRQASGYTT